MGTSATNGARRRQWIAPRRFWRNAVRGRGVAASSEKRVQKTFREASAGLGGQRAGRESGFKREPGDFTPEFQWRSAFCR